MFKPDICHTLQLNFACKKKIDNKKNTFSEIYTDKKYI